MIIKDDTHEKAILRLTEMIFKQSKMIDSLVQTMEILDERTKGLEALKDRVDTLESNSLQHVFGK